MAESSESAYTVTRSVCEPSRPSSSSDTINKALCRPPSKTGIVELYIDNLYDYMYYM